MDFGFQSGGSGGITPTQEKAYFSGYSELTQQNLIAGKPIAMEVEVTDLIKLFNVQQDAGNRATQFYAEQDGIYNIQFSAQVQKSSGGGSQDLDIYLSSNANIIPFSNTRLTLANNGHFVVASWNWFLGLSAGSYFQIVFVATDTSIQLVPDLTASPAIPSIIMTVSQVD